MTNKPLDPTSILWIREEIELNSEQAISALEGYFEHDDDQFIITAKEALHQMYGTLHMVELYPPSTLAQELEVTLEYIVTHNTKLEPESISDIIQCISLISRFIDGVIEDQKEIEPNQLVHPLNILRSIRNEPIIEPLIQPLLIFQDQGLNTLETDSSQNIYVLAKKLLKLYQYSYLKFMEETDKNENLIYMTQSVQRFSRLFPQKNLYPLWGALTGALESLKLSNQYAHSPSVNEFLGKTAHLLKIFASPQTSEVNSKILTALFLHAVKIIKPLEFKTDTAQTLLKNHQSKLQYSTAPEKVIRTVNKSTLYALSDALMEELSYAKDSLDVYSRSKDSPITHLNPLHKKLKQLSDSMLLIRELEIPRQALEEQTLILDKIITTLNLPTEDWLVDLATALLFVESSILGLKDSNQKQPHALQSIEDILAEARKSLLRETLVELSKIKALFVDCVSAHWDPQQLTIMSALFLDMKFRLFYIDETQAIALLEKINHYINNDLLKRATAPQWNDIEEFADIIAGLDQYLYLKIETVQHSTKLLESASNRLDLLSALADDQHINTLKLETPEITPMTLPNESLAPTPIQIDQNKTLSHQEDEDEDEEIKEIFKEELDEIIEDLIGLLRTLSSDTNDFQCIESIRRLAHTIKGSGRVAHIPTISEPAWALESRLNEMLENNLQPSIHFIHSISEFTAHAKEIAACSSPKAQELSDHYLALFKTIDSNIPTTEQAEDQLELENSEEPTPNESLKDELTTQVFTLIEQQEIENRFTCINHYLQTNINYIDQAPQDENTLRAIHTLKAILNSIQNTELSNTFAQYETLMRTLMTNNQHRQTIFFDALTTCCKLVTNIINQEALEQEVSRLKKNNIILSEFLESQQHFECPYNDWLALHYDIFDRLIKNKGMTSSIEQHTQNIEELKNAAKTASEKNLHELQHILQYYVSFLKNLFILPTDKKSSFVPNGTKMQEMLLEFADKVALGHGGLHLETTVKSFLTLSAPLETYVKSTTEDSASNKDSIPEDSIPEDSIPEDSISEDFIPEDSIPEDSIPEDSIPEDSIPEDNDEIMTIFKEELNDILESMDNQLNSFLNNEGNLIQLQELQRDYHTIKGGANYINEHFIFELAKEADLICERYLDTRQVISPDVVATLLLTQNIFRDRLNTLPTVTPITTIEEQILDNLRATKPPSHIQSKSASEHKSATLKQTKINPNTNEFIIDKDNFDIVEIFLEEAEELLISLEEINSSLAKDTHTVENNTDQKIVDLYNETLRIVHTLKGGARLAGTTYLGDITHTIEQNLEIQGSNQLLSSQEALQQFAQEVRQQILHITQLWQQQHQRNNSIIQTSVLDSRSIVDSSQEKEILPVDTRRSEATPEIINNPNALSPQTTDTSKETEKLDDYDQEILEIFYEESKELVEELEKAVGSFKDNKIIEATMDQLKRILHTIKGSARLAGFAAFGNQAHLFESYLETLSTPTQPEETRLVIEYNDGLFAGLQKILKAIENHLAGVEKETQPNDTSSDSAQQFPIQQKKPAHKQAKRKKNTEVVRIGADLLEKLVNLAGETVISRSSVQMELLGFTRIIDEFGLTLDRIRDQIRNFETETENRMMSQSNGLIISDHTLSSDQYHEFDTLEMDRFSSFHQLARSLSESASDLLDMRDSMSDKVRTTEALVMQQSRIQTQLHEGLMQSRMVPFSRLAPRLTRMVRQIADELGKNAKLTIVNAEGEMDRSVLERMIPPLEHMLRNSLDHGIEDPKIREKIGKPVMGHITLHLFREGNEIVLRLSDDGAGIDVNQIRRKAIQQGLLSPQATLTEKEILQFIFKPGFSTAKKVTQISGRGVGMDVVFSEIKQLNGTLKIHAAPNIGTQFTIRLPFTVSMSRALMVKAAEDIYAIPLTHIEGVVRVSPYELTAIYESKEKTFSYADKQYEVQYLGTYLHTKPHDTEIKDSVPLLLARNTERAIAVQVDNLIGSREVVIKNAGPQLSQVVGLSGATILGDGSVVLILDLNALIRDDIANNQIIENNDESFISSKDTPSQTTPLIMVVDDSVTVRKVTSRLLERHGMDVITAKDGIDAVTQLRETSPNLILLDIEMPRMDGFEVASHIRHDPRLSNIPIIMISSRTGEKHRTRAQSLDVNYFLGKPYQELQLIEKINELVTMP